MSPGLLLLLAQATPPGFSLVEETQSCRLYLGQIFRTADVDFQPAPGHQGALLFEGEWTVRPRPGGGATMVHQTAYDPGSNPGWMVRPFLGRTLERVVADLGQSVRAVAEAP